MPGVSVLQIEPRADFLRATPVLHFSIHTDGSAIGNPGPCGAGLYIISHDTGEKVGRAYGIGHGNVPRAELMAVVLALRLTPKNADIDLYTDCTYVVNGVRRLGEYRDSGWRRPTRKGLRRLWNRDLWQQLNAMLESRVLRLHKVKAHADIWENGLADHLARTGAMWAGKSPVASGAGMEACYCPEPVPFPADASFVPDDGNVMALAAGALREPTASEIDGAAYLENQRYWRGRCKFGPGYDPDHGRPRVVRARARTHRAVRLREGNHFDFVYRYRKAAYRAALELRSGNPGQESQEFFEQVFEHVTDFPMLRAAWEHNESGGSLAKGVDGRGYDSYSRQEKSNTLRDLSGALRDGTWRPGKLRRIQIDKPGGRGKRPIDIPTVKDRVVETALNLALTPILDPAMHESSVGFRPGKSIQEGLARAIWYAENQGLTTMVALDLRKAFSRVPRNRLCDVVNQMLPCRDLVNVIHKIIRRPLPPGDGLRRKLGLAQGSPLSPILLNLYLTKHLDVPWATEHPGTPLVRYADDLLLLGKTPGQARFAVARLRQRLEPHGMLFRDDSPVPVDLQAGGQVEYLGYRLGMVDGRVQVDIPWYVDPEYLSSEGQIDRETAIGVLRGILDHAGPCYPGVLPQDQRDARARVRCLLEVLSRVGIHPALPRDEVLRIWFSAYCRWLFVQNKVTDRLSGAHARGPGAPHPGIFLGDWVDAARKVVKARASASWPHGDGCPRGRHVDRAPGTESLSLPVGDIGMVRSTSRR